MPRLGQTESTTDISQVKEENTLLSLTFVTVNEYLFCLREAATALSVLKGNAILYLAAAVSDFYIPSADVSQHKIQSVDGPLTISMAQVPKMLKPLVSTWCPEAYIITFKLETNQDLIGSKAERALALYKHKLVISNLLQTRKEVVNFVTPDSCVPMPLSAEEIAAGVEIEVRMIAEVLKRHKVFLGSQ